MNILVLKHVECGGLGLWEECCREASIRVEVVALRRNGTLPPPHRFQAVICLGGPMNVYEEEAYPFLKREDAFIRQVLGLGIPFLGVCLGGQLLAKAVGGIVTQNRVKEIGWHAVELDQAGQRDPLFTGLPERLTVFQWHGDTFSIPKGAVRLATSSSCESQAFRYGFGGIAYALQFHLEATPAMVEDWVREYAGELTTLGGAVDAEQMLAEASTRCEALRSMSRRVFQNFHRMVELRYAGVGAVAPVEQPAQSIPRAPKPSITMEQAWEAYRVLMATGRLRCGITCPLDRIGQCTGGCW
ncbi:MAG TPA: type 1 glutamine amidotransferase [Candidatus Methylomirabilis sp.]|nr:type 1 glutamine amidotransferase [Candidatus Methylomirabilis sp.]